MDNKLLKIEQDINKRLQKYIGCSVEEIGYDIGKNPKLLSKKASIYTISSQMLKNNDISPMPYEAVLNKMTLLFKSVQLNPKSKPVQSMSFELVDFNELITSNWSNSFVKNKFSNTVFCFTVFKEIENKIVFIGVKVWKMPIEILNKEVKAFWTLARSIVLKGVELERVKKGSIIVTNNNLPGLRENPVIHMRPKANDSNDKIELPDGQMITKQAYWFNASFVGNILKDMENKTKKRKKIKTNLVLSPKILKEYLNEDLNHIPDLLEELKRVYPEITEFDVTESSLKGLRYKLVPPFLVKSTIKDVDLYIEKMIFKKNYFNVEENQLFQTNYVKRKIRNYIRSYKLVRVDTNIYLTETGLKKANLKQKHFIEFLKSIEKFKYSGEYFTLNSIRKEGFVTNFDEFGFSDIFFEELIKTSQRIKTFKILTETVYVKSKDKKGINHVLRPLMREKGYLKVEDWMTYLEENLSIFLDYSSARRVMKNSGFYFSDELDSIFTSKNAFLNYLYA